MSLSFPADHFLSHHPTAVTRQWFDLTRLYLTIALLAYALDISASRFCVTRRFFWQGLTSSTCPWFSSAFARCYMRSIPSTAQSQLRIFVTAWGTNVVWLKTRNMPLMWENNSVILPCFVKTQKSITTLAFRKKGGGNKKRVGFCFMRCTDGEWHIIGHRGALIWLFSAALATDI